MFNVERLELARRRRRYTAKILAERAGISPITLSRIINDQQLPDQKTIDALIGALDFPPTFFYEDVIDPIDASAASFRSLTAMSAKERDAALAAGSLAYLMADWVRARFNLPDPDLIDLGQERDPAGAARTLREYWGIGERPISHMIKLLEAKGVRVFSLAENTKNVDAFSCWRNGEPYIFLNTFKSAERSRFDAAHELGHLILHKHGGPNQGRRGAEYEANMFASHFLMPPEDLVAQLPIVYNLEQLVRAKKRWGVSVSALAYGLHKLNRLSDWTYRGFCIQINQKYKQTEPNGIPSEYSSVWQMVMTDLWKDGITRDHIASDLHLPPEEVGNLMFGLTGEAIRPDLSLGRPELRMVD